MKKIVYSFITVLIMTLLFPINVIAITNDIAVFHNDSTTNDEYLIYPSSGTCKYVLNNDGIIKPNITLFQSCTLDSKGHPVIVANRSTAQYLWMEDNNTPFDLETNGYYDNALNKSMADNIYNSKTDPITGITRNIAVIHGERTITIENPKMGSKYMYIIEKVASGDNNDLLAFKAGELRKSNDLTNPYLAITRMQSFEEIYYSLLPSYDDSRWIELEVDKDGNYIIHEPLTTKKGDVYIVWIMEYQTETPNDDALIDLQIMNCLREDEVIKYERELPRTGVSYLLNGLLGVNMLVLPIIYFKRRKLIKNNI